MPLGYSGLPQKNQDGLTMRAHFLTAAVPLCKTITPTETQPYPHTKEFTSHSVEITTAREFHSKITAFAAAGGCLLKGQLLHPLKNQSRAGATNSNDPTQYVVIDIDRCDPMITQPEQFIHQCLPQEFQDITYTWQWSNSAGISKQGLAGHLIFILSTPVSVQLLKKYLTHLNFLTPALENQIRLAHNGQTLTYGLDATCAQNDKLIFIAPPKLVGISDPYPQRFSLIERTHDTLTLHLNDINISQIEALCQAKLKALRTAIGLPHRRASFKTDGGIEYLKNPEQAIFRAPYIDARGFRYGNLNNGDSYAYFHTLENPKFLHNFKGEPVVRIQDIDPAYWRQLNNELTPVDTAKKYLAFRDRQTDCYITVIYDTVSKTHQTHMVKSAATAFDFLKIYQQPLPETLPIWDMEFNPQWAETIDFTNQKLNLYQPTEYIRNAQTSHICPPIFLRLITHVVGDDPDMRDELLNWLAFIFQFKEKAQTAFILHGHTGTGKGVLFTRVIQPILGFAHCPMMMMEDIDSAWNDWIESCLLAVIDEAQIGDDLKRAKKRINKIKNLITEAPTLLKKKFANHKQIKNYANFIFTSNEHDSIWINANDRRFKVCPRQEKPIVLTPHDLTILDASLQDIANYLLSYPVSKIQARAVPHNAARADLIQSSQSGIDEFINIIKQGDLEALSKYQHEYLNSRIAIFHQQYVKIITEWTAHIGKPMWVSISDLRAVYMYIFSTEISPVRFGRILASKNIQNTVRCENNTTYRAVEICWTLQINPEEQCLPIGATVN